MNGMLKFQPDCEIISTEDVYFQAPEIPTSLSMLGGDPGKARAIGCNW